MRELIKHGPDNATFYGDIGYGEFYIPRNGISYSDPQIGSYFEKGTQVLPRVADDPWLTSETDQLLGTIATHSLTIVEGDLGAGKSTLLYGLRTRLRAAETPYTLINGHYLDRGAAIAKALGRATTQEHLVLIDSFDYLFMRNTVRRDAKRARPVVTEALQRHLNDGGKVVATVHTSPWFDKFSQPQLHAQYMDLMDTASGAAIHRVQGLLEDPVSLHEVCQKVHGADYADAYVQLAAPSQEPTSRTYRVVKLLGKLVGPAALLELSLSSFDTLVRRIDATTRAKMGATPDYQLLIA